jgi:hypothetical protein
LTANTKVYLLTPNVPYGKSVFEKTNSY